MKYVTVSLTVAMTLILLVGIASGGTWYVGSGGFVRIQEAIDAAAPGDTIRIGPGWHSYWAMFEGNRVYARITKDNLRFIGAGMNETFVGPTTPQHGYGEAPSGFYAKASWGVQRVVFEDLAVANVYAGIRCDGPYLEVAQCRFWGSNHGMYVSLPLGGTIADSRVEDSSYDEDTGIFLVSPSNGVTVTNCTFEDQWWGVADTGGGTIFISNCGFVGCRSGLAAQFGTNATVRECRFSGDMDVTAYLATVSVTDCIFEEAIRNNLRISYSSLSGTGNVFTGGGVSTIYIESTSQVNLHGCHILNGGNYSVELAYFSQGYVFQNMSGNYWGTTDIAQIDAWIWDQRDNPAIHSVVNYLPMADGPVQTESATWGAVKTLFR